MRDSRIWIVGFLLVVLCAAWPGDAAARWGVGPAIRPGVVPQYSAVETSWGVPMVLSAGVRAFGQRSPFFRMGGEIFFDFPTETISGGGIIEGVIPLGLVELDLGGVIGYGTWGIYLEPGISVQIGAGVVALNARLSYQWQLYNPELCCNLPHRGMTYLTIAVLFGDFTPAQR